MKDAYWFRHDSNARNDEKIIDLRGDLGYEGYGIYWALIEFLRDTENYEAEYKPKRLAMALQADEGLIQQVIESYRLFHVDENGKFYSKSLKARMKEMDQKREQQRQNSLKRWNNSKDKDQVTNSESHGIAVALPSYSHNSIVEDNTLQNIIVDENTPDERVQGEKGAASFFSQCLNARNAYPVILFFEYLHFTGNYKFKTIEENRSKFIEYWKNSKVEKSGEEVWSRLTSMAALGFKLSKENVKKQLALFDKNHKTEKSEAEYYSDFLEQLRVQGFTPVNDLKELVGNYLKI